jgi:dephospho-CoA kinase
MTPQEAQVRIKAQASALERAAAADFILNSNQPLPGLLADATALWNKFLLMAQEKSQ